MRKSAMKTKCGFRRAVIAAMVCAALLASCQPGGTSSSGDGTSGTGAPSTVDTSSLKPQVVTTSLPLVGRTVTLCTVKDFGAKGDGETDDTKAFTDALAFASGKGGGTVYVPAGRYVLTKSLSIPKSVYLIGEWYNPDEQPDKIAEGSILYCKAGKEDFLSQPFLSAGSGAGAMGLTVYYPENRYDHIVLYPAALGCMDASADTSGFSTFRYITLINPYYGVAAGPNGNESHIVEHIYMTPLDRGMYVNMCTDIGRVEGLHIAAKYYELFDKTVDGDALRRVLKEKQVTGLIMQRSDWQHGKDIVIEDIHTGMRFERNILATNVNDSTNSAFINVKMSNVVYGIDGQYARKMSETFTGIDITTDGSDGSACLIMREGFNASVFLTGGTLSNSAGPCVIAESGAHGSVHLSDLTLETYTGAGVSMGGSALTANRVKFAVAGLPAVKMTDDCRGASIDMCDYAGGKVENATAASAHVGTAAYETNDDWNRNILLPSIPLTPSDKLYLPDVKAGGKEDNTSVIQNALDEAASGGGGIVYLPGGKYLVSGTLSVPAGVELRGVSAGPHHTTSGGTFLLTTQGKGEGDGTPFITVAGGAGVNGFSVWYPEQKYNSPATYPATIRVTGQDAWIANVNTANVWQAIDLASADTGGHYLAYNTGMAFKNAITVDGSTKTSYIYNCHYNPHFYGRTRSTGLAGGSDENGVEPMMLELFGQMDSKTNGALILRAAKDQQVYDFFNYRQKVGLYVQDGKDGGSFSGNLLMLGFDACSSDSLVVDADLAEKLVLISMTSDGFGFGTIDLRGEGVAFINSCLSCYNSDARLGLTVNSGNVTWDAGYFRSSSSAGNATVIAKGGRITIRNSAFGHVSTIRNDESDFNTAWETAVRDFQEAGGGITVENNIGMEHFGSEPPGGTNLVVVYE